MIIFAVKKKKTRLIHLQETYQHAVGIVYTSSFRSMPEAKSEKKNDRHDLIYCDNSQNYCPAELLNFSGS